MNILRKATFLLAAIGLSQANAYELTLGGQVGALGLAEGQNETDLGYGAFFQALALEILSLQVDYLRSEVENSAGLKETVHGIVPNLMWIPVKFDELRFGIIAGPGFYDVGEDPWRFGLSAGAFGEVSFIPQMPIGLQARYHSVLGGKENDLWSVFMTLGFRFDVGGNSGDNW